jgi:hypothetical protein
MCIWHIAILLSCHFDLTLVSSNYCSTVLHIVLHIEHIILHILRIYQHIMHMKMGYVYLFLLPYCHIALAILSCIFCILNHIFSLLFYIFCISISILCISSIVLFNILCNESDPFAGGTGSMASLSSIRAAHDCSSVTHSVCAIYATYQICTNIQNMLETLVISQIHSPGNRLCLLAFVQDRDSSLLFSVSLFAA